MATEEINRHYDEAMGKSIKEIRQKLIKEEYKSDRERNVSKFI